MAVTVIFSPSEGFWNDEDGWGLYPSEASLYYNQELGQSAIFIGVNDATYVYPSNYKHLNHIDARQVLFDSLSQYSGDQIAAIMTTLSDDEYTYEGDSIWLVNDRTLDDDNLNEIVCNELDLDNENLLLLLNTHAGGKFYYDNEDGFYHNHTH